MTLALLLSLIRADAASLPNGKRIKAVSEPLEIRHIFPRAYLNKNSSDSKTFQADRLGNPTIVYRTDQQQGGYHIRGSIRLTGWQWSSTPGLQAGEGWALDLGDGGLASVEAGDSGLNRALCSRRPEK